MKEQILVKPKYNVINKSDVEIPKNYGVFLLNNSVTAFEAVVDVLKVVFSKSQDEAYKIMIQAHTTGKGLVLITTKDEAFKKESDAYRYIKGQSDKCSEQGRNMFYSSLEFLTEEV